MTWQIFHFPIRLGTTVGLKMLLLHRNQRRRDSVSTTERSSQLSPTFRHRNPAHNSSSKDFIHPPFVLLQEIRLNSCSLETVMWYSELAWKHLFTEPLQAKAEMFFQKEPNAELRECGFKSGHLWVNFGGRWPFASSCEVVLGKYFCAGDGNSWRHTSSY